MTDVGMVVEYKWHALCLLRWGADVKSSISVPCLDMTKSTGLSPCGVAVRLLQIG